LRVVVEKMTKNNREKSGKEGWDREEREDML
jgi:hypothetical protein